MSLKYFKSDEIRKPVLGTIFCLILLCVGVYIASYYISSRMHQEQVLQNMAVMGAVIDKYPDVEAEVVGIYTKGINTLDIEKGREIARRYGYDEQIPRPFLSSILSYVDFLTYIFIFMLCIFAGAVCFLFLNFFRNIYNFAESVSQNTDRIMKGEFDIDFSSSSEGAISCLAFQLELMASRIKSSMESLHMEKNNLKEYLSDISHQLKTPLASLRVYLDLLTANLEDNIDICNSESNKATLDYISKSNTLIDRMEWLIQALLSMSRIEYSVVEMNIESSDLVLTIDSVLQELWFILKAKNIKILTHLNDKPVYIKHDSNWLGQAIENIIRNCVDFSPDEGVISIKIDESECFVRIKIKDDGPGISEEAILHMFERFYSVKPGKRSGNGIGLSLAKIIIEKHHGLISAENVEAGGALFTVSIPKFD